MNLGSKLKDAIRNFCEIPKEESTFSKNPIALSVLQVGFLDVEMWIPRRSSTWSLFVQKPYPYESVPIPSIPLRTDCWELKFVYQNRNRKGQRVFRIENIYG